MCLTSPELLSASSYGQFIDRKLFELFLGPTSYIAFFEKLGFRRGKSSPCIFHHKARNIITVVHGDDFTSLACEENIMWLRMELEKVVLIKDRGIEGPDDHDLKEINQTKKEIVNYLDAEYKKLAKKEGFKDSPKLV